jgi:lysophospholipase L1-like esterase
MRSRLATVIVLGALMFGGCSGSSPTQPTSPPPPGGGGGTPPPTEPPPPPTPPPAPVPRLGKLRFVAFGDSLTEGVISAPLTGALVNLPHAYPARLADTMHARYRNQPEIAVFNEGRAGEFAADGVVRLPDAIKAHTPDVLLLMEGANDINFLGRRGITRVVVAIEDMIKDAHRRGVIVFVATLPAQRATGHNGTGAAFVDELNTQLRRTVVEEGATLVDVNRLLDLSFVGQDGLHLTEAGYVRLSQIFDDAIRQAFETQ